mgnify:CR=1 FL=1
MITHNTLMKFDFWAHANCGMTYIQQGEFEVKGESNANQTIISWNNILSYNVHILYIKVKAEQLHSHIYYFWFERNLKHIKKFPVASWAQTWHVSAYISSKHYYGMCDNKWYFDILVFQKWV